MSKPSRWPKIARPAQPNPSDLALDPQRERARQRHDAQQGIDQQGPLYDQDAHHTLSERGRQKLGDDLRAGILEPWDWSIPAKDSRGRSSKLKVDVPPQWIAQIMRLYHEGVRGTSARIRPWKSPAHVTRCVIMAGLRVLGQELEHAREWLQEYDIEQRNQYHQECRERARMDYESTAQQVRDLVAGGDGWFAAQLVRANLASAKKRTPTYWTRGLIERLEGEFGELLTRYPKGKAPMELGIKEESEEDGDGD